MGYNNSYTTTAIPPHARIRPRAIEEIREELGSEQHTRQSMHLRLRLLPNRKHAEDGN